MIHLDTNFLIYSLNAGTPQDLLLREWLLEGEIVQVSLMAWAEFLCGPVTEEQMITAVQLFKEPVSLTRQDAERGAALFNEGGRRSGSLADCIIAAACMRAGASLATANLADFDRFVPMGLKLA